MADKKIPKQRDKHITGGGLGVRKGGVTGGGGVGGGSSGSVWRPGTTRNRKASGRIPMLALMMAILVGGGGLLSTLRTSPDASLLSGAPSAFLAGMAFPAFGWSAPPNTGKLNTAVDGAAREKFTVLRGGGLDTATVLVYLCGGDLESKNGMATTDLREMTDALSSPQVNVLVYAGGCSGWQNDTFTDGANQLWRIQDGELRPVPAGAGTEAFTSPAASMTDPETLSGFLSWGAKTYPADRNFLILWDHGGGSLAGYGYDENHPGAGSLSLDEIGSALEQSGVKFDFVGFDACFMGTAETALTLSPCADYLIASEGTEPGVGWNYTGWLTDLAKNSSLPTLDLGRKIADDFADTCARSCRGQSATMSVTDLAELGQTLGGGLEDFARDARRLLRESGYGELSAARTEARDFPASTDQVDLAHFARNLGTDAGNALADAVLSAVKYNRAENVTNAYGLAIYFPSGEAEKADRAVRTWERLGLAGEYARCIREYAAMETAGQSVTAADASPVPALSGTAPGSDSAPGSDGAPGTDGTSASDGAPGTDAAPGSDGALGTDGTSTSDGASGTDGAAVRREQIADTLARSLPDTAPADREAMASYIAANQFDPSLLRWTDGKLSLPEEQWKLVSGLDLNLFYDDGEGYIDLGLDNTCEFDDDGALIGQPDGTWVSINGQPVAYYHLSTAEDGERYVISGRVPVLRNGERCDLILLFTDEEPHGYIAGARPMYTGGETETVFRGLTDLQTGDELVFLCDYYGYDGAFQDEYTLGDPMTVTENMEISNTYIGGDAAALYRFTDLYGNHFWTEPIA